ncbi:Lrp/AsnC family transcriptional regulator [Mucilaginibacter pocheonensis]|uniref:DNA-binding Lrp family transcriptional regulator n=1 Tax=Mucilaginibacter pocheonensis TaxID=398050 RepID=A0ABU1T7V0_9SPHI|nr:Lrp/AsnC family transcriptional regulator [Mucilaginibacter pocheonensis]MDR6941368.1 DNA-binding Lrp family transcriptional regulator [Mucilaginibacter pocheonensis]
MVKKLDETDLAILDILQANGRIKLQAVADQVGLTTSPVHDRMVRMERDGYIRRYGAVINKKMLGLDYRVILSVTLLGAEHADSFELQVTNFHEVELAYQLKDHRFLLFVTVKDEWAYAQFIIQKLRNTGLVSDFQTHILKKEFKSFATLTPRSLVFSFQL